MSDEKTLNVADTADAKAKVSDVEVLGDPDMWRLLCKASSKAGMWMKSTKALEVPGGVVVQVTTQQGANVAEALTFVPSAKLESSSAKTWRIITGDTPPNPAIPDVSIGIEEYESGSHRGVWHWRVSQNGRTVADGLSEAVAERIAHALRVVAAYPSL